MLLKVIYLLLETLKVMLILFKQMTAYICGMVVLGLMVALSKDRKVFKAYKVFKGFKVLRVRKVK